MRLTSKEIAQNLKWFDELKILPAPRVARELAIKALKDLQEIDEGLAKIHDEIFEGYHKADCDLLVSPPPDPSELGTECDCGYEAICELIGISS